MNGPKVLQFDLDSLPATPFSIYFLNEYKEVEPRQIFTATEKRINHLKSEIELFILEKCEFVIYTDEAFAPTTHYCPN